MADAGKGSKWRKDFDFDKFYTNMDTISGAPQTTAVKVVKKNGKVTYVYK